MPTVTPERPRSGRNVWFYMDQLEVGGVERILLNLTTCLIREGWEPTLVLNQARGELLQTIPRGLAVIDLQASRFASAVPRLATQLRQGRPAILISQRGYLNAIAALAHLAAGRPGRLVLMEHSLVSRVLRESRMPTRPVDRLIRWLGPAIYRFADAIVGVSQGVAADLERTMHLPSGSARVLYNPAIPDPADLRQRVESPISPPWPEDGKPLIVTVGRLSPEKGYDLLLEAFQQLLGRLDARLAIIGNGPEQAELERRIRAGGLEDRVHLLGYQSNPYAWLHRADTFVLSSVIESFPTVILEAMAVGTPVVAFDCPEGPREIIRPDHEGLLVPPRDPEALAQSLYRVLVDRRLAQSLAEAGHRRAECFTFERTFQAYEQFFEELLTGPTMQRRTP